MRGRPGGDTGQAEPGGNALMVLDSVVVGSLQASQSGPSGERYGYGSSVLSLDLRPVRGLRIVSPGDDSPCLYRFCLMQGRPCPSRSGIGSANEGVATNQA